MTTTLHVHHAFLYLFFPFLHDYLVKMPNFAFYREKKTRNDQNFLLILNLDMVSKNSILGGVCLHLTEQVGRNNSDKD